VRDTVKSEIDRRGAELADADRINAVIERRAEERARELYEELSFRLVAESLQPGDVADEDRLSADGGEASEALTQA
jgi:hypothetical protein